ncbi:MAG: class I SAM-dependent methyltransferase [Deltaproteobacteria bacterium]|nr:class I SAM-dependent methyltransferase [Deltaproteobacteria bacterium]
MQINYAKHMSTPLKNVIKRFIYPSPLPDTIEVLTIIKEHFVSGYPFCPFWQGDFLFLLSRRNQVKKALEIGFATGSTALYILCGMGKGGEMISVDYKPEDFGYLGKKLVDESPWRENHKLIEGNTNIVLPELYKTGFKFDLIFMDGWKTFDHLMVDVYYCIRLLKTGGHLAFDDAKMNAVDKVISLLLKYYEFKEVDYRDYGEDWKLRLWLIVSNSSFKRPYRAFKKIKSEQELPVTRQFDWWRPF